MNHEHLKFRLLFYFILFLKCNASRVILVPFRSWKPYAQAIWVLTILRFFVTLNKLISAAFRSHGQFNHEEFGSHHLQPKEFAEVSIKDIDQVAKSSFPLCMRHLFEKVRNSDHLNKFFANPPSSEDLLSFFFPLFSSSSFSSCTKLIFNQVFTISFLTFICFSMNVCAAQRRSSFKAWREDAVGPLSQGCIHLYTWLVKFVHIS